MYLLIKTKSTLDSIEPIRNELERTCSTQNCSMSAVEYRNISDWVTHLENLENCGSPFVVTDYRGLGKIITPSNLPLVVVSTRSDNIKELLQANGFKQGN